MTDLVELIGDNRWNWIAGSLAIYLETIAKETFNKILTAIFYCSLSATCKSFTNKFVGDPGKKVERKFSSIVMTTITRADTSEYLQSIFALTKS